MEYQEIDRAEMKAIARETMRSHQPSVYLVTLVLLVLLYFLGTLSLRLQYPNLDINALADSVDNLERYTQIILAASESRSGVGSLLGIAVDIMEIMLSVGFISFCLNAARGLDAGFGDLFDGFGIFFKALGLWILMNSLIVLWSLLFVIPGIIAAYRYSMAINILLDDPDKGVFQCIAESKEMTNGYKMQLFLLDLSFLGWIILSAIPFVGIYTRPYITLTKTNYYRTLSGKWDAPEHVDDSPWG